MVLSHIYKSIDTSFDDVEVYIEISYIIYHQPTAIESSPDGDSIIASVCKKIEHLYNASHLRYMCSPH